MKKLIFLLFVFCTLIGCNKSGVTESSSVPDNPVTNKDTLKFHPPDSLFVRG